MVENVASYLFNGFGVFSAVVDVTFAIVRFNNASKLQRYSHDKFKGRRTVSTRKK